jgi:hypothetical protein
MTVVVAPGTGTKKKVGAGRSTPLINEFAEM